MSKLKNIWSRLQYEFSKEKSSCKNNCTCSLPDLLLICKIMESLPEEYFLFKSGWMLTSKADKTMADSDRVGHDKTIENLTGQLCAYEKTLQNRIKEVSGEKHEAFVAENTQKNREFKYKFACHYCKKPGHKVKFCYKWKADGKPLIQEKLGEEERKVVNAVLIVTSCNVLACENVDVWFVDNGATNHITFKNNLYSAYEKFEDVHSVLTADGNVLKAEN